MASSFPGTLDSFATNRSDATVMATNQAADHNNYADAINKIEAELGTSPSSGFATVTARLASLAFNVQDYGAVSGGSATTNTTAFQAAIDAAATAGGGTVLVPPGSYVINQIRLKSSVQLLGTGWGSVLTCNNNVASAMITLDSTSVRYARIRHLYLNGNKAGQTTETPSGVLLIGAAANNHHVVEDCFVFGFKNHGVEITTGQHSRVERNYFYGNDGCGVYVDTPDCVLEGNKIATSGLECVFLDDGASNAHSANNQIWGAGAVDAARGDGIRIKASNVSSIQDESADHQRHGWNLETSYYNLIWAHVENNNISTTGGAAYRIAGGGSHFIRGHISGGGRGVHSSLLQFDTDGSSFPHSCNIEIDYSAATIGANPETVGTIASDNKIVISNRVFSGGQIIDSTNTATGLTLSGTFSSYGIDTNAGTFTSGAIRLKNNTYIVGRNAAGAADVNLLKLNASNAAEFGPALVAAPTKFIVGGTTEAVAGSLLDVIPTNVNTDPLVTVGGTTNAKLYSIRVRNNSGQCRWFIVGTANDIVSGSTAGDAGIGMTATTKFYICGSSTIGMTVQGNGNISFFGATPIAKPTVSGSRGANAALASVLTALASYGLIVDSSSA